MKTQEVAQMLRNFAAFLEDRPDFRVEGDLSLMPGKNPYFFCKYYDKNTFVEAVKALGDCTKTYTDGDYSDLRVTAKNFPIQLSISRDRVCKKEVKYICEPLFSTEEVESL